MYFSSFFQIFFLFTQLTCLDGTVTQSPSFACAGDSITVSCVQTVPNAGAGDLFDSSRPNFIIGTTNLTLTESTVNGNGSANGFDLSRFTVDTNPGNFTEVTGSITLLSYIKDTDEGLRIGCANYYRSGGAGGPIILVQALTLLQAVPPSISSAIPTIQNLNPSTCEGTLRFNLAATSDRDITSYSILFNGSSIEQNIAPSSTYDTNTIQFLLNTNYPTSIIATSCAGNSNDGDASVRVNGYMQSDVSCAQYNAVTGAFTIDWTLNTPSQPTGVSGINNTYSVGVTYSHSNGTVTYLFTDTSNFNLISTVTTYDVPLTPHNFTNPQRVETNIITNLRILQQCGQDLVGTELSCTLRSVIVLPDTTPTVSTITSVPSSTSSMLTTKSTTPTTPTCSTNTLCCISNTEESSQLVISNVIFGLLFLIAVLIIAMLILVLIFMARKIKQLNSALTVKTAASHPYQYIDLDKLSGNISSPTQQQSPQDYVPMSSVHKQDSTQPPFYANLK